MPFLRAGRNDARQPLKMAVVKFSHKNLFSIQCERKIKHRIKKPQLFIQH
jgi:hypothetical protein